MNAPTDRDLITILRGDPPSGDDYRRALAGTAAEGFVLVNEGVLAAIAANGPADGTVARQLALTAILASDLDVLVEALVHLMWIDARHGQAAA